MSFDSFKSSIAKGSLIFGALTGCASPQVRQPETAVVVSDYSAEKPALNGNPIHLRDAEDERQELKGQLILALETAFSNEKAIKQIQAGITRRFEKKDFSLWQVAQKKVDDCLSKTRSPEIVAMYKQIKLLIFSVRADTNKCTWLTAEDQIIECNADAASIQIEVGRLYLNFMEKINAASAETIDCLDSISP